MVGFLKVQALGYLGKDPEVRFAPSGTAVGKFSLGCTSKEKGQDGNWADATQWVNVVVFGKLAELCGQYLGKGKLALVHGRQQTREYEKDGQRRTWVEIVADEVQFLSAKDSPPAVAPGGDGQLPGMPAAADGGTFHGNDIPF